jgi:gluconokinase
MGVSGAGKSVVGAALARALGAEFHDGDDYHPPSNRAKMASGIPLDDVDRAGWLATLAGLLEHAAGNAQSIVVACSALKRSYRDTLRAGAPGLRILYLHGPRELIARRLSERTGHFMPPSLLESQFATLEPPQPDELAIPCDVTRTPDEIARQALAAGR